MRKVSFSNEEYYHIYNRGVDKRDIFCGESDYLRFLESMREFNNINPTVSLRLRNNLRSRGLAPVATGAKPLRSLVRFICYGLNKNHYHFILKQVEDGGISELMKRLSGGYTAFFNRKYDRSGSLFQGSFKAIHIDNNSYLLWLSGYINGNIEIHGLDQAENHQWCSYPDYLGKRKGTLCKKDIILSQFDNISKYKEFVKMTISESKNRKDLEKYFIE